MNNPKTQPITTIPARAIRVYTALLTQEGGTVAPTVVVLQNNIGTDFVWTRTGAGMYTATANTPGLLTDEKTTYMIAGGVNNTVFSCYQATPGTTFVVETFEVGANTTVDGKLYQTLVEVRVYA